MGIQLVELHFRAHPICDYARIRARAEAILGTDVDGPDPSDAKEAFLLFYCQHRVSYKDAEVPAQTAILARHQRIETDCYAEDIQQSWGCPHAKQLLQGSEHTLLVTEMMARLLSPKDRLHLFHGALRAVIEETAPDALVFKHSQQVIDPQSYLAAKSEPPILRPGSVNVRFFEISNSAGDMIMDTRGLDEVGLHDLQCHYRDLDPNKVSRLLFNTAVYVCENGPVIESGHTVDGIEPKSKWTCQFENSLLEPTREVLDLNPGVPYAAGTRH